MSADAIAFIYARTGSRRLPGKVLLEIDGHKVIDIVYARASCLNVRDVVVLTTNRQVDDSLAAYCNECGYSFYRGDSDDLVMRTLQALAVYNSEIFVRVNADCPLFEPTLVNKALRYMSIAPVAEMVSNVLERSFPYGVSVECVRANAYKQYAELAFDSEREHVTQHLYRLKDKLNIYNMRDNSGDHSQQRLTLDTPADFQMLKSLFSDQRSILAPYWDMQGVSAPEPLIRP